MKLKGYRVMAGYSQKDMADKLKMGVNSYNLKENDKREFNKSEMESIYIALKEKLPELKFEDLFF